MTTHRNLLNKCSTVILVYLFASLTSLGGFGSCKAMMSYLRTVIVSFCLEDILESAIGVYTRGPKYSSNVTAEEILLCD